MVPLWYLVAMVVPNSVVTGVVVYALFLLPKVWDRRWRRALEVLGYWEQEGGEEGEGEDEGEEGGEDSREERWRRIEEEYKNTPSEPLTRLVFRPDLYRCVPLRMLLLGCLVPWGALGGALLQGKASPTWLLIAYGHDVMLLLPGVPTVAYPRLLVPAVVGAVAGAVAAWGVVPSWVGWVAPVAMSVGLFLTLRFERWVRDPEISTKWDVVMKTIEYYPLATGSDEVCARRWTINRMMLHGCETEAGLRDYRPPPGVL